MQFRMKLIAPLWAVVLSAGAVQAQDSDAAAIQESTNNVLAALGVPTASDEPSELESNGDLISIVGEAMANGESDDYINALVVEAHSDGQIEVTDSMKDSSGEVDSTAMLNAIVSAAIASQPAQQAPEMAALETDASEGGTDGVAGRTYTVKSGDTLLRIAKKHYGDAKSYKQILDANPNIKNANLISIGMVLSIPE